MMPVPSHLQELVVPLDSAVDEEALHAAVRCPCGEVKFELPVAGCIRLVLAEPCSAASYDKRFDADRKDPRA